MDDVDLLGALRTAECQFKSDLKIVHLNAQSLKVSAHATEFQVLFDGATIDVICVSESFYHGLNDYVQLSGYNLFSADRTSHDGGGVAVYVRDHYSCRILKQSVSPATRVQKPD